LEHEEREQPEPAEPSASERRTAAEPPRDELRGPVKDRPAPTERRLAEADTPQLVDWAQTGDSDALNELFARHYQTMLEMARRRLGSRLRAKEEPDDLAQTTFREATRDFLNYTYRGEGSLLRWLIQILQNKIRDRAEFYSASKRDLSLERSMESAPPLGADPLPTIEPPSPDLTVTMQVQRDENFDLLREALSDLSPLHRKAITLVFFQGLSLREAGAQMGGRTEDAVRMMLRRAEGRLGELLRRSLGKDIDRA
jgi:RNA polymerase sigma factor (sigma-70 family)